MIKVIKILAIGWIVCQLMGCASAKESRVDGYQRVLMTAGRPSEVVGYPYGNGFLQFQRFSENVSKDTIIILSLHKDKIKLEGGVSIENFEYFDNMDIVEIDNNLFFIVTLRNSGNANGNMLKALYIDKTNGHCYPAEFVRADSIYATRLTGDEFIWNDQTVRYNNNEGIFSEFFIWRKSDVHSSPSVGKVVVKYEILRLGKNRYRFLPQEMNFTPGGFSLDSLSHN